MNKKEKTKGLRAKWDAEKNIPFDFFIEQMDSTSDLMHEMNKDYVEIRTDNIKQKREFYQHLTVLSGAIIGLSSIFGYEEILNIQYFNIGVFLHLLFIVIITLYFREVLDIEGNELLAQQDRYNIILEERRKIINNYIGKRLFTKEDIISCINEMMSSEGSKSLESELINMEKERKDRLNSIKEMDFSGELFISLFIFASFFIFISFFFKEIGFSFFIFAIILILVLIFTDSITFFIKKISKLINLLKNGKKRR